jgi:hypothetical protein
MHLIGFLLIIISILFGNVSCFHFKCNEKNISSNVESYSEHPYEVVWNTVNSEFLLLWVETVANSSYIYSQRFDDSGNPLAHSVIKSILL